MNEKYKNWLLKQLPTMIGAVVGIAVGYWYYLKYGCTTNACPITANPYKTSALFGIMGGLLGSYVPFPIKKS
jgi:hypothetical protein